MTTLAAPSAPTTILTTVHALLLRAEKGEDVTTELEQAEIFCDEDEMYEEAMQLSAENAPRVLKKAREAAIAKADREWNRIQDSI